MEVQSAPSSVDETSLLYKLQRKLKVFNTSNNLTNRGYNLLATSTKFGLVFVTSPQGILCVYNIKEVIDCENNPKHIPIKLPIEPTHVGTNCDQEWLAVIGGHTLMIFNIPDFQNPNVRPSATIRIDVQPSTFVSSIQWNPCISDTIGIVYFDGTLVVSQVNTMQTKKIQSKARCLCWSPKGKQLVTGNMDGTICQYKPDLTLMKTVPAPNIFENAPHEAMAIHWISTYQFAIVYKKLNDNSRPAVTIVNTPKVGTPICVNFEDICYSLGSNRPWYYYLIGFTQWNLILTSSSNSIEIGTLGSKDGATWTQWCQNDEARPELPLTDKNIENYPVGICTSTSAAHQLPWGENEVLPPMPFLLVLSHTGLLTVFNIINIDRNASQVCSSIQPLTLPASSLTSAIPDVVSSPEPANQPISHLRQALQSTQQFTKQPQAVQQPPSYQAVTPPEMPRSSQPIIVESSTPIRAKTTPAPSLFQEIKMTPQSKSQVPDKVHDTSLVVQSTLIAQAEMNAALKCEQEKINKAKVNQELQNMLIKEVNDFQMELYKFRKFIMENLNETQEEINSMQPNIELHGLSPDQVKQDSEMEELRDFIIQLKLELVRTCAAVAEARTQAEVQEEHEWTQADPLTTKRFNSIKQLAFYVENQLEQAQKAIDYKWAELLKYQDKRSGHRMIHPILDDVYQPLVKQQNILTRHQAVLKTLRNTLKECSTMPFIKTASLFRCTPFKNTDPLSKLTKNILNMSIEAQDTKKKGVLSTHKLDALRDFLSNHKPKKIKPVNIELHKHLAQREMQQKYEKSIQDQREQDKQRQSMQKEIKNEINTGLKTEIKQEKLDIVKQHPVTVPATNIKPAVANVVRTLNFTEEPIKEPAENIFVAKPQFKPQAQLPVTKNDSKPAAISDSGNTKVATNDNKNSENVFDNRKICSPFAFSCPNAPTSITQTNIFTSKPIADMTNMFSKFTQQLAPEVKTDSKVIPRSDETGEAVPTTEPSVIVTKPETPKAANIKPIQNILSLKSSSPLSDIQNVPDVLKSNKNVIFGKSASKENQKELHSLKAGGDKKETSKPFTIQSMTNLPPSSSAHPVFVVDLKKPNEIKIEKSLPSTFFTQTTTPPVSTGVPSSQSTATSVAKSTTSTTDTFKVPVSSTITSRTPEATKTGPEKLPQISKAESVASNNDTTSPIVETSATVKISLKPQPDSSSARSAFTDISIKTEKASQKTVETGITTTATTQEEVVKDTSTVATSMLASTTSNTNQPSSISPSPPIIASEPPTPANGNSTSPTSAQSVFSAANKVVFGIPALPDVSQAPSVSSTTPSFGSNTSTFGTTSAPATDCSGTTQASTLSTSQSSPFGTATQQTSIFGTPNTTSQTIFGSSPSTTPAAVFASANTTQGSIFGSPAQTSVFGQATTTQSSIFGAAPQQTSIFGLNANGTSVFGTTTSQASAFGTPATQASVFGSSTPPTQGFGSSQPSVFGSSTQSSLFGTSTTTTQSGSLFGDGGANLFASASISTTTASPQSGGSIFGSPGSAFGSTNVFGGKASFNGSNSTATNIFGGGSSTFAQKPAQDFWGSGNTTSGFGSGFGQQSSQPSVFGSPGGSFSQPSTAQPFSNPQSESAFGSPQPSSPAFGGSPAFGSKPSFGSPPSFGGSGFGGTSANPGFGSSATFGSGATFGGTAFGNTSPKAFGGSSPSFSPPTQSNATFENLATQNTLTFGNLAQQTGPSSPPAPSFNASPSFTAWRG
ncbi:nuclear pore complex protein Nup214 isoform X3 [Leptidea sinapis]|uniref:nuclear pore complex protein Nup214 isoform X3 n=1 Tax=Leptidea sinapis TaxID=189913 RepID=UPI0021C47B49|nr:nuclear pore complex protein Nup214 isoform X3 [Leptidea sinapis]